MSLLFRARPAEAKVEQRGSIPFSQVAHLVAGAGSTVLVDGDSAMRHDAVWSCRTRIAQDVSMMPVDVVRYVNSERQDVPPPQIIAAPSSFIPAMDWRYQVVDSWLGWGNAWGIVTQRTANGLYPNRIELLNPVDVRIEEHPGEPRRFYVDNVERFVWPVGDLWHVPAYTLPGSPIGMSPIQYHRATISGGLNAAKFGSDFFVGGGLPSSILTVDPAPADEVQAKRLKDRLLEITRGNREPLVLPAGTEYKQISVNPNDSQFIDTQRYSVEQICRIFGEDPADHGASSGGTSLTYANRRDSDLARFKRRQFWVTKMQDSLTALLPRPQVVKLNTSSSLMMTAAERHELHRLRLESKTTTVNEVRRIEDEVPFGPEFDAPGIPGDTPDTSPDDDTPEEVVTDE